MKVGKLSIGTPGPKDPSLFPKVGHEGGAREGDGRGGESREGRGHGVGVEGCQVLPRRTVGLLTPCRRTARPPVGEQHLEAAVGCGAAVGQGLDVSDQGDRHDVDGRHLLLR